MTSIQIIVLAVVQGLTEFLPVSSSGHLVLVPRFLGWQDQGIIFDISVHLGSLIAVCIYFRRDLIKLVCGTRGFKLFKSIDENPNLLSLIILSAIPAAFVGFFTSDWIEIYLRNPMIIAATLPFYGVLMWVADKKGSKKIAIENIGYLQVVIIGFAQVLALIPGTSRSGITMTAALFLGMKRIDAAKFSFLMSIPVIMLAAGYKLLVIFLDNITVAWNELFFGMTVSLIVAYLSIGFFMKVIQKIGLMPFAIYRILLSVLIIWVFF
jgi:undecaprenyl-diphosphatase